MDKQQIWTDFQYHDNNRLNYAFVCLFVCFFAESGGQTPRNMDGQNRAGNVKGSKQNFQMSDLVNILVSVNATCKGALSIHSAAHKSLLDGN